MKADWRISSVAFTPPPPQPWLQRAKRLKSWEVFHDPPILRISGLPRQGGLAALPGGRPLVALSLSADTFSTAAPIARVKYLGASAAPDMVPGALQELPWESEGCAKQQLSRRNQAVLLRGSPEAYKGPSEVGHSSSAIEIFPPGLWVVSHCQLVIDA
jgi:hypothetical protein